MAFSRGDRSDILDRMAAQGELQPGTLFAGDFEIVGTLGQGGMGAVYVARQRSTGAERALKLMHPDLVRSPELRAKFEQEARIGARIDSDHVAQVLAAGVDAASGMPWIAMELLRGETLAARVERGGPMPWPDVVAVFGQVCHALAGANRQSIVHRDLKPENIFLATPRLSGVDLMVKLLDFGIAKVVAESTSSQTGVMGTPLYMAPEQYQGRGIGAQTDVWALGLIAFYLLTGKNYWRNAGATTSGPAMLMYEVCMDDILPGSTRAEALGVASFLPQGFDAWFAGCVARDPAARFADAGQVIVGMRALAGPASIPGGRPLAAPMPGAAPMSAGSSAAGRSGTVPVASGGLMPLAAVARSGAAAPGASVPGLANDGVANAKGGSPRGLVAAVVAVLVLGGIGAARWASRSTAPARADVDAGAEGVEATTVASASTPDTASASVPAPSPTAFACAVADAPPEKDDDGVHALALDDSPVRGNPSAPVTIVEFSDFQCPFGGRAQATLDRVRETYGDKVRFVFKNLPLSFHARAEPAAEFALEAAAAKGSKGFWAAHDLLFKNQQRLEDADLSAYAALLGLDAVRVQAAISGKNYATAVPAHAATPLAVDQRLAAEVGATAAPTFFINGRKLVGAQPFERFKAAIDRALVDDPLPAAPVAHAPAAPAAAQANPHGACSHACAPAMLDASGCCMSPAEAQRQQQLQQQQQQEQLRQQQLQLQQQQEQQRQWQLQQQQQQLQQAQQQQQEEQQRQHQMEAQRHAAEAQRHAVEAQQRAGCSRACAPELRDASGCCPKARK
jgi:protein-disulfide isomerase